MFKAANAACLPYARDDVSDGDDVETNMTHGIVLSMPNQRTLEGRVANKKANYSELKSKIADISANLAFGRSGGDQNSMEIERCTAQARERCS